jgi:hypothetical protein
MAFNRLIAKGLGLDGNVTLFRGWTGQVAVQSHKEEFNL